MTTAADNAPPRLVLATRNRHKTAQIALALRDKYTVTDMTADEFANLPDVEETGATFEENAVLKAVTISSQLPPETLVLADDSGLCVLALNGAPGVISARFAGPAASDAANNLKLLTELYKAGARAPEQRGAYYSCVLALAAGGKLLHTTEGRAEGTLIDAPRGEGGFGYDPLFVPAAREDGLTFAELSNSEKLPINHRGQALTAMTEYLASR